MKEYQTAVMQKEVNDSTPETASRVLSRRRFLSLSAVTMFATAFGSPAALVNPATALAKPREDSRGLNCYNPHTREHLNVTYWVDGKYILGGLAQIYYFFRDYREDEYIGIDTRLIDLMNDLAGILDCRRPLELLSGYRTAKTNAMLRRHSKGVAAHSYHITGEAADIRLPGCPLRELRKAAEFLKAGGVGCYPRHNYIHIDVGPVRYWWR